MEAVEMVLINLNCSVLQNLNRSTILSMVGRQKRIGQRPAITELTEEHSEQIGLVLWIGLTLGIQCSIVQRTKVERLLLPLYTWSSLTLLETLFFIFFPSFYFFSSFSSSSIFPIRCSCIKGTLLIQSLLYSLVC